MLRTMCKSKIHRATVAGMEAAYQPVLVFVDEENRIAGSPLRACGS